MGTYQEDFQQEIKVNFDSDLINCVNVGEGTDELNSGTSLREFNDKGIHTQYFNLESIKVEEIDIKTEDKEGDQFNTNEFNEKQIQDEYFDSKAIKQEEIDTKTVGEQWSQLNNEYFEDGSPTCGLYSEPFTESKFLVQEQSGIKAEDKGKSQSNTESSVDESDQIFKCFKCSYRAHTKNRISRHIRRHMSKTIECPSCPYKTNEQYRLKDHKLVHLPKGEAKLHKCPECDFTSKREYCVTRHLLTHKPPDEITWYQCPQCPYKTKHKANLTAGHILVHRKELRKNEEKGISESNTEEFLRSPTVESKNEHRSGNETVQVNNCTLMNISNGYIKEEESPMFKCFNCNYRTHKKNLIVRHVRCHTPKTIECPCCPYKTNEKYRLEQHKLIHLSKGETKLYKCLKCSFSSKRKGAITQHLLTHKKPDEITWFQCPECPYKSKRRYYLENQHMIMHREAQPMHKCTLCSYESHREHNLRVHMKHCH